MTKRERIYIIPTLYGFIYGAGSLFSLICAILYANNLAYLLCFFLLALFVVGMHQSNSNLKKLELQKIDGEFFPAHSQGIATVWLKSQNPDGHVQLEIQGKISSGKSLSHIEHIPKKSLQACPLTIHSKERGQQEISRIKVSSRYPFGLFYVWRHFKVQHSLFIYPKPFGDKPLPLADPHRDGDANKDWHKGEDFHGHRNYIVGESQRRVDWKALARGKPMLIKEYIAEDSGKIHLPWLKTISFEEQLQQMSRWVLDCASRGQRFSMDCEQERLSEGHGWDHAHHALKILTLSEKLK